MGHLSTEDRDKKTSVIYLGVPRFLSELNVMDLRCCLCKRVEVGLYKSVDERVDHNVSVDGDRSPFGCFSTDSSGVPLRERTKVLSSITSRIYSSV